MGTSGFVDWALYRAANIKRMTLKSGDRGQDVRALRKTLEQLGLLPTGGDETYDDAVVAAIRRVQEDYELQIDGITGPATLRALAVESADSSAPVPDYARMSDLARETVTRASVLLRKRVREVPLGSNRGPDVDLFLRGYGGRRESYIRYVPDAQMPDGWRGAPWCAAFIAWCAEAAAVAVGNPLQLRAINDLMGCRKWHAAGRAVGSVLTAPEPGSVGLITRNGSLAHAVLIARVEGPSFWSIEGNSSGDRVRALKRSVSTLGACVGLR